MFSYQWLTYFLEFGRWIYIIFKTKQFNTLDETNLKDIVPSINYRLFFEGMSFEKKPKNLIFVWKGQKCKLYERLRVYLFIDLITHNYIVLKYF